jgi:hypothetical protein
MGQGRLLNWLLEHNSNPPNSFASSRTRDLVLQTTFHMEGPQDRDIRDWDEADVHNWLSFLGYPHYENQIRGELVSVSQALY